MAVKKSGLVKAKSTISFASLQNWNRWFAGVLALQGVAILVLSATRLFPIQTSYLAVDPVQSELSSKTVLTTATHHVFDLNLAYLVAIFLFISAIAHVMAATSYREKMKRTSKQK